LISYISIDNNRDVQGSGSTTTITSHSYWVWQSVAELLLNKVFVAATPGGAFGDAGRDYLRLSYATSKERIREALDRMDRVLG